MRLTSPEPVPLFSAPPLSVAELLFAAELLSALLPAEEPQLLLEQPANITPAIAAAVMAVMIFLIFIINSS